MRDENDMPPLERGRTLAKPDEYGAMYQDGPFPKWAIFPLAGGRGRISHCPTKYDVDWFY